MTAVLLRTEGISKRFDTTQALDDVSLDVNAGEIHALLGENGAGKSNLIKIITGIHEPDEGQILLDGVPVHVRSPIEAQALGIAAIYQEPIIFPDLNVAENIFITHRSRGAIVNWGKMYTDAEDILAKLGVRLDVRMPASGLTLAQQQTVEIAKAISLDVRLLIMDEPTASLSAHEVSQLFHLTSTLRDNGVGILFISHRLEEVFEIAERVTVLRDGRKISSKVSREVSREGAIRDMVGREVEDFFAKHDTERGDLLLSVRGLGRRDVFSDINFDLYGGEVLGLAGLVGSRRTDVGLSLFGIEPADTGEIVFQGKPTTIHSPDQALKLGIAYVTEDRHRLGLNMPFSITDNITLPMLNEYLSALGLERREAEADAAERFRQRLSIRTPSISTPVNQLSGGNQQKVLLSKWLNSRPLVMILDEPTRGIDVGAKAEVHHMINDLASQGLGIILISSDMPEIMAMSDRILVMREGEQTGVFDRAEADQEKVLAAAMGAEDAAGKIEG
jgi:rhamnose transport system ATP-binding protein